jgi:hypothetical protein
MEFANLLALPQVMYHLASVYHAINQHLQIAKLVQHQLYFAHHA